MASRSTGGGTILASGIRTRERKERKLYSDDWALGDEEIEGHHTFDLEQKIKSDEFTTTSYVKDMTDTDFNLAYVQEHGFIWPLLFRDKSKLGIQIPDSSFTINDVRLCVGSRRMLDVMDVNTQKNVEMTMKDWQRYFESQDKDKLLNVISLEFSHTKLESLIQAPTVVRQIDWVERVWPRHLKEAQTEATNVLEDMMYPKVQKYCLMSVRGCYTDFHIDFGGTSVWYHVLRGKKIFWLIPPTERNLQLYEQWVLSGKQSDIFFGDTVGRCGRVELNQGNTFFIPTGWIHAVYTPEDSLVFGGNFLHSFGIEKQLRVAQVEDATHVPSKFRYPFFTEMLWYVLERYVHVLLGRTHLTLPPDEQDKYCKYLSSRLKANNNNKMKEDEESDEDELNLDPLTTIPPEEHKHLTQFELHGLKAIVMYLHALPTSKKSVPELITDPIALIRDVRTVVEKHRYDKPELARTSKPVLEWWPREPTKFGIKRPLGENTGAGIKRRRRNSDTNRIVGLPPNAAKVRHRRVRCKLCESCLREDCRKCQFCLDMTKYGGPGTMKQTCKMKKCTQPILPGAAVCYECGFDGWNRTSTALPKPPANTPSSLFECCVCFKISHLKCISSKFSDAEGVVNEDLPNSWECPECVKEGYNKDYKHSRLTSSRMSFAGSDTGFKTPQLLSEAEDGDVKVKIEVDDKAHSKTGDPSTAKVKDEGGVAAGPPHMPTWEELQARVSVPLVRPMWVVRPPPPPPDEDEDEDEEEEESGSDGESRPAAREPIPPTMNRSVMLPVFRHLSVRDLCSVMRVCRQWAQWAITPSLWTSINLHMHALGRYHLMGIVRRQPRSLDLSWADVTPDQLAWLLARLPQLRELRLVGQSWPLLACLSSPYCPALTLLDISHCEGVTDSTLTVLLSAPRTHRPGHRDTTTRLRHLTKLHLAGTQVGDEGVRAIVRCLPFLTTLDMSECQRITESGVALLAHPSSVVSHSLATLDLRGCHRLAPTCLPALTLLPLLTQLAIFPCHRIPLAAIKVWGVTHGYTTGPEEVLTRAPQTPPDPSANPSDSDSPVPSPTPKTKPGGQEGKEGDGKGEKDKQNGHKTGDKQNGNKHGDKQNGDKNKEQMESNEQKPEKSIKLSLKEKIKKEIKEENKEEEEKLAKTISSSGKPQKSSLSPGVRVSMRRKGRPANTEAGSRAKQRKIEVDKTATTKTPGIKTVKKTEGADSTISTKTTEKAEKTEKSPSVNIKMEKSQSAKIVVAKMGLKATDKNPTVALKSGLKTSDKTVIKGTEKTQTTPKSGPKSAEKTGPKVTTPTLTPKSGPKTEKGPQITPKSGPKNPSSLKKSQEIEKRDEETKYKKKKKEEEEEEEEEDEKKIKEEKGESKKIEKFERKVERKSFEGEKKVIVKLELMSTNLDIKKVLQEKLESKKLMDTQKKSSVFEKRKENQNEKSEESGKREEREKREEKREEGVKKEEKEKREENGKSTEEREKKEEGGKKAEESLKREDSTKRAEESAKKPEETGKRAEESAKRGEESTKRGDEATKRGEESAKKAEEIGKRAEESTKRQESVKRAEEGAKRAEEGAKRAEEGAKRAEESAKRAEEVKKSPSTQPGLSWKKNIVSQQMAKKNMEKLEKNAQLEKSIPSESIKNPSTISTTTTTTNTNTTTTTIKKSSELGVKKLIGKKFNAEKLKIMKKFIKEEKKEDEEEKEEEGEKEIKTEEEEEGRKDEGKKKNIDKVDKKLKVGRKEEIKGSKETEIKGEIKSVSKNPGKIDKSLKIKKEIKPEGKKEGRREVKEGKDIKLEGNSKNTVDFKEEIKPQKKEEEKKEGEKEQKKEEGERKEEEEEEKKKGKEEEEKKKGKEEEEKKGKEGGKEGDGEKKKERKEKEKEKDKERENQRNVIITSVEVHRADNYENKEGKRPERRQSVRRSRDEEAKEEKKEKAESPAESPKEKRKDSRTQDEMNKITVEEDGRKDDKKLMGKVKSEKSQEVGKVKSEKSQEVGKVKSEKSQEVGKVKSEKSQEVGKPKSEKSQEVGKPKSEKSQEVGKPKSEKSQEVGKPKSEKSQSEKSQEIGKVKSEKSQEIGKVKSEKSQEMGKVKSEKSHEKLKQEKDIVTRSTKRLKTEKGGTEVSEASEGMLKPTEVTGIARRGGRESREEEDKEKAGKIARSARKEKVEKKDDDCRKRTRDSEEYMSKLRRKSTDLEASADSNSSSSCSSYSFLTSSSTDSPRKDEPTPAEEKVKSRRRSVRDEEQKELKSEKVCDPKSALSETGEPRKTAEDSKYPKRKAEEGDEGGSKRSKDGDEGGSKRSKDGDEGGSKRSKEGDEGGSKRSREGDEGSKRKEGKDVKDGGGDEKTPKKGDGMRERSGSRERPERAHRSPRRLSMCQ